MKRLRYITALFSVMFLLKSCQTLEETYKDYAGDGKIRYIGKCSNVSVTPGWKRLSVKWENGIDATIEHIKVVWTGAEVKDSVLLPAGTTEFELENLEDDTYRLDICALDGTGKNSLVETNYGRPYTESHEVVRTFSRGVTKFFKVNDNLFCFLDQWDAERMVSINLKYTATDGTVSAVDLKKYVDDALLVLPEVDLNADITIEREGKLKDCADTIRFEDYVLGNELNLTSDFKLAIQRRYGFTDRGENEQKEFRHFLDTVRVLEFDYDMTSFEDILYCPNLKKLVLGKNRYMNADFQKQEDYSNLSDERCLEVLKRAQDLLSADFTIEQYNNHYWLSYFLPSVVQEMGNPELPALDLIPTSEIDTITCSMEDPAGHDSHLEYLVDNDPTTTWEPLVHGSAHTYEIVIKLKKANMLNGIKVVQKLFNPNQDNESAYYLPGQIRLQYSMDQIEWHDVTFLNENILGRSSGEVTLLPMSKPQEAQYIRATLVDQPRISTFNIRLADISLY